MFSFCSLILFIAFSVGPIGLDGPKGEPVSISILSNELYSYFLLRFRILFCGINYVAREVNLGC